ncbi:unnamed protein product, partial [Ectocarpus sp. 8 AP-2014]
MSIRQIPIMRQQSRRLPSAANAAEQHHPRPSNKRPREEGEENGDGPSAVVGGASPREERKGDEGGGGVGCVCYICDPPALPGKFDVPKAKALNVPHGPLFGELQRGNDVTLEDGTVIKPFQVLGPAKTGAAVVIVDCPSPDLLPSLVSNPAWERLYYAGPDSTPTVNGNASAKGGGKGRRRGGNNNPFESAPFFVHVAPAEVVRSPEYGEWARRFGPEAKHLVTRQPFCSPHTIFQAAHDQVVRLNQVCGAAFPVPRQFVGGVPWDSDGDGVGIDGSGSEDTRGGGFASEDAGIIPPEVRRIGREELDFGGKV